jgi:fused signal recognition particle receptor
VIFRRLFGRTQQEEQQKQEVALTKTRRTNLFSSLFERSTIDEDLYEDLEAALIGSDVGVETTEMLINDLRTHVRQNGIRDPQEAKQHLKAAMVYLLEDTKRERTVKVFQRGVPWVMMVVGVNGAGKTTTIGKLAYLHKSAGRKVMIAAGDTFRAAAIEQLQTWSAERLGGVPVIATKQGGDPGAVVFDAMAAAHNREMDILIVDTAGRLENKEPLMRELEKVRGIMKKTVPDAPQETLLVIDANTGQNGLHQARIFTERVDVTEIALAKLDGTAKGGIVIAIARRLGLPIRFIGIGEQPEDFGEFDAQAFATALVEGPRT